MLTCWVSLGCRREVTGEMISNYFCEKSLWGLEFPETREFHSHVL
jgi:hypothetical protein